MSVDNINTRKLLRMLLAIDAKRYLEEQTDLNEPRRSHMLEMLASSGHIDSWIDELVQEELEERARDGENVPDELLRLARSAGRA